MNTRHAVVPVLLVAALACRDSTVMPTELRIENDIGRAVTFASTSHQIAANYEHACALDSLSTAWCWGYGQLGELGSTQVQSNVPLKVMGNRVFSAVTVGQLHSCALTPAGAAYCWGYNGAYILGGGSSLFSTPQPLLVPGGRTFRQISAGGLHSCAVTLSNTLFCWGMNLNGSLGDGNPNIASPIERIGTGRSWLMVSAGDTHTCALTTDSLAFCWGLNQQGQLGTGDTTEHDLPKAVRGARHFARINARGRNTCAVDGNGAAWCWGDNARFQLGVNSKFPLQAMAPTKVKGGRVFRDISAGVQSACALGTSGTAWCWGSNAYMTGGFSQFVDSVPHKVETRKLFSGVSTANLITCGRTIDRLFYCWGYGFFGSLGNGADTSSHVPVRVRKLVSVP